MAGTDAQKSRDRPLLADRHEPPQHPYRPPARASAVPPGQPRHAAYGEPLVHHAPVRPRPRRALVVRSWYQKKRVVLPLATLVALVVIIGVGGTAIRTSGPVAAVPATSTTAGSTGSIEAAAVPVTVATPTPTRKATAERAEVGDVVKAGDWQFEVTNLDCGKSKIGDGDRRRRAEGEFCLLEIKAKNNSDTRGTVAGDRQKLSDDDGETYRGDREATVADDPSSNLFVDGVEPGRTARGTVVFDVPTDVRITGVTLTGGASDDSRARISLR